MARAVWNGVTLAESGETVIVEGNHYFPPSALESQYFESSDHSSVCPWKGTASYFSVEVDGQVNRDAVWYYPEPKAAAKQITGRVAFWKGVQVR